MYQQLLPRNIAWRRQYDAQRYARHLSQPELNQRIRDILLNLLRVNPEATAVRERMLPQMSFPAAFGSLVLHDRFSASRFWDICRAEDMLRPA